ncbi:MAG: hypothetical protein HDS68_09115 [Bacteroidales bacterium]|nr:hypothetical protein [Bacteroidales bacterium]
MRVCHNGSSGPSLWTFGFGHDPEIAPISLNLGSYHLNRSDSTLAIGILKRLYQSF